jgi:shikimate kinase
VSLVRIVLVGFMGSGKSTVGQVVAGRLRWHFRDLDTVIEERARKSVARIFAEDGEERFRALELAAARESQALYEYVIAAGGGAFAQPETRAALATEGAVTVWLRCDMETLLARLPSDGSRPLARNRETIRRLLEAREPSYRLADTIVDATGGPALVAERVVEAVLPERARSQNEGR